MSGFTFKQFHIEHDKCAMKVGTDGILLGAWANLQGAKSGLDIGTGTGLIALMLKQRNPAMAVTAVEIDDDAVAQAKANIAHSPWPNIDLWQGDIAHFNRATQFDLIVSNPPYFNHSLTSDNQARMTARHTNDLSFQTLLAKVKTLLSLNGQFFVVLPYSEVELFEANAEAFKLTVTEKVFVHTKHNKPAKRVLMSLKHSEQGTETAKAGRLDIHDESGNYSAQYKALCRDFYLKF
jgi:tRNA1Val (adenine37-N6)-methyltransferase